MVPYSFTHCHPGQHRLEWSGPRIRRTGARKVTGTPRLRRCGRLAAQHSRSAIGMWGPAAPPQTSGRAAVPAVRSAGGSMTYEWEGRFLRASLCVVLFPRPAEGPRKNGAFAAGVHVATLGGPVGFGLIAISRSLGLTPRSSTTIERLAPASRCRWRPCGCTPSGCSDGGHVPKRMWGME